MFTRTRHAGLGSLLRSVPRALRRKVDEARWMALERRLGLDAEGEITAEELGGTGSGYQPIRAWMLTRLFRHLPLDPGEYTFVDLGSGKGRALLVGARHGFRVVLGVEANEALANVSRENAQAYRRALGDRTRFDIRVEDAAASELPEGPLVIFMFNPFGHETMTRVIANIESSFRDQPRPIYVAYWNAKQVEALDRSTTLSPLVANDYYRIYQSVLNH